MAASHASLERGRGWQAMPELRVKTILAGSGGMNLR